MRSIDQFQLFGWKTVRPNDLGVHKNKASPVSQSSHRLAIIIVRFLDIFNRFALFKAPNYRTLKNCCSQILFLRVGNNAYEP